MPDNTDVEAGASGAHEPATSDGTTQTVDPRALLSEWANENDEWVRHVVGEVLSAGTALGESGVAHAYALFRQEKALDERTLPSVAPLDTVAKQDEAAAPLTITKLSDVQGVNALTPGSVIEPHAGLTILFGENGTGKTGYSRIFKALAASRTADEILGDIAATEEEPPSARVTYKLGDQQETLEWAGEIGVSPFTRMSIFDSPSVSYHVDDDLDYVYVPAALALFNHVIAGLRGVQGLIDQELRRLNSGATSILSRIPREASVYPIVETLGASTDLVTLKAQADWDPQASERVESLRQAVAALQANTLGPEISLRQHEVRVLQQATLITQGMQSFSISEYNGALTKRAQLQADYQTFRSELFAAADLPAEPDETWSDFIAAGDEYQQHLTDLGVHDAGRCLYCRQTLSDPARELLGRYATYLEDKISDDIRAIDRDLSERSNAIRLIANTEVQTLVEEYQDRADKPEFYADLRDVSEGIKDRKSVV